MGSHRLGCRSRGRRQVIGACFEHDQRRGKIEFESEVWSPPAVRRLSLQFQAPGHRDHQGGKGGLSIVALRAFESNCIGYG